MKNTPFDFIAKKIQRQDSIILLKKDLKEYISQPAENINSPIFSSVFSPLQVFSFLKGFHHSS